MGRLRGTVAHDDQRGRLRAALRDAQQRAHAQLAHAVLIEHFAIQAKFGGHGAGAVGQDVGGHEIGGFIRQSASEVLRLGEDFAALRRWIESDP